MDVSVDVILDEFTNVGILTDFEKTISTVRKYGIRIFPIFQDIGQVMNNYPKTYTTILANCALSVYLGGNDVENTAKYYSKLYGTATVIDEAEQKPVNVFFPNLPRFHKKFTVRTKSRPIYTEDEILNLEPDCVIVKLERRGPLKLKKFDYRDHPLYKETEQCNIYEHIPDWQKQAMKVPYVEESVKEKKEIPKPKDTTEKTPHKGIKKLEIEQGNEQGTQSPKKTIIASARKVKVLEAINEELEDEEFMLHDNRVVKDKQTTQKNLQQF